MKLPVINVRGEEVGAIEVDERVFGIKPNRAVVHQALLAHLANRRVGTANTKTRGEVRGSTAKIRRQKGTGRARLGSIRAPHLRHGGVVFGPKPRSYAQRLPKRMRRLAVRSVLSDKVVEGRLRVVEALSLEKPRTKDVLAALEALELRGSTLIVTGRREPALALGARNIPETKVMLAAHLNVVDLLSYRGLLMTVEAVRAVDGLWGGERAVRRRAPVRSAEEVASLVAAAEGGEAPRRKRARRARPKAAAEEPAPPEKPARPRKRKAAEPAES